MCKVKRDYNQDFSKYVKYDETSSTFLVWTTSTTQRILVGTEAGSRTSRHRYKQKGGSILSINRTHYSINRVIWSLFNGYISPDLVIDHIDGDPWNNNINNLRAVDTGTNQRNLKMFSTNTSGLIGVGEYSYKNGSRYFMSNYSNGSGKTIMKTFSVFCYGEDALSMAVKWREDRLKELAMSGIIYSDRHGT